MVAHPKSGQPVKITNGPLQGKYFIVTDYLTNQFQGKLVENIAKSHPHLTASVVNRGFPLDDKLVFGRMYPTMDFCCVHDDELKVTLSPVEVAEATEEAAVLEKLADNVKSIKSRGGKRGKKNGNGDSGPPNVG